MGRVLGAGLLIGIVGKRKGCAGGGEGSLDARAERFERLAALSNGPVMLRWLRGDRGMARVQDKHESLILAQNERWRQA